MQRPALLRKGGFRYGAAFKKRRPEENLGSSDALQLLPRMLSLENS